MVNNPQMVNNPHLHNEHDKWIFWTRESSVANVKSYRTGEEKWSTYKHLD
jgi:hypothetical protein